MTSSRRLDPPHAAACLPRQPLAAVSYRAYVLFVPMGVNVFNHGHRGLLPEAPPTGEARP